jgi:tryptophan halogenase
VDNEFIQKLVIVGGGTAGWMTAAALSKLLGPSIQIVLVESEEISTIGVGEATIPPLQVFNDALGIDEDELLSETQGTFKLGIEFVNWGAIGDRYVHGFGRYPHGLPTEAPFYAHWQRLRAAGCAQELQAYSINTQMALAGKMLRTVRNMPDSPLADVTNAFHFDASLYAKYLRRFSEARGVVRKEGRIVSVPQRSGDGFIEAVVLASGERIEGDFFVDCSGMHGLLIEKTLQSGFEDWSHWLPCNRAIAVPCASGGAFLPLTRSTAHSAGWQWRIPLQHRIGNGHVYSSEYMSDDEAAHILMGNLDGAPLADPRYIRYSPGKRRKVWNKNCVAIGLSSGFLEPLESTSIHLIQTGITRLVKLFPSKHTDPSVVDAFNAEADLEYRQIRDFLILHYKATTRSDSSFWNYCREMEIPQTLQQRLDLYQSCGRILVRDRELFLEKSWLEVFNGQGICNRSFDPLVLSEGLGNMQQMFSDIENTIQKCVDVVPTHSEFIRKNCAARTS